MRIGFDAKRYFENRTGLGNFSRNLINGLIKHHPEHDYILYTPVKPNPEHISKNLDISKIKIRYPKKGSSVYYRTRGILKDIHDDKLDIYHGLSNELPFGIHKLDIKTIVTIHDLIFKDIPEDYNLIDRMIYDWKSKYACEKASAIHSISEATKESILKHYKINPSKVNVAYQGIDPFYLDQSDNELDIQLLKDSGISNPFILFVGNYMKRKNLESVLRALTELDPIYRLVTVLPSLRVPDYIRVIINEHDLADRVINLVKVEKKTLKSLYSNTVCLVYPSLAEGWGLPVEEAIACGASVILPGYPPFTELESNQKIYLEDPKNAKSIANAINSIINKKVDNFEINHKLPLMFDKILNVYSDLLENS